MSIPDLVLIALKAIAIGMLVRIAVQDFTALRIKNDQVLALLAVAVAIVATGFLRDFDWGKVLVLLGASAVTFVILFVFWLLKKVGAGDVKLFAVVPLLVGTDGSVTFVLALLLATVMIYLAMKFPVLLPQQLYRVQLEAMRRDRRIPFGVPISIAAILALLLPVGVGALLQKPVPPPLSELSLSDLQ
ncbi:MAG TPA: prepilin peptidase [Devosia sp.]